MESVPKISRTDRVRSKQVEFIIRNGCLPSIACERCLASGEECIMDHSQKYSKCASCTCQGRFCCRDFHTENEWSLLWRAQNRLSSEIEKNDAELDLLGPELSQLQNHLAALHEKVMAKQKQYQGAMARQRSLRKQMDFLKQKESKMSEHDAELLRILDGKNGEAQPSVELVQLAASSDNPSGFTQMAEEIGRLSPPTGTPLIP